MQDVTANVMTHSPDAIIIVVANPLDAMAQAVHKLSGLPRARVIGMAGVLDSSRFRTFIAMELGVSVANTNAFVLGGHGDTMVPLPRYSTVGGVPITELMSSERIEALVQRTRDGGAEVVSLLKTGSAFYAPAAAVGAMVDAIVNNRHMILPCAAYLEGQYGIDGLYVGVPTRLGSNGVEGIVEIGLTADEQAAFDRSAAAVQELVDKLVALGALRG
jgi:malate dehydrogenase